MARKCKRKHVKVGGRNIALPCKATKLTASHKATLDNQLTASDWNRARKATCRVVFFTSNRVGVRCKGRKLSTSAKSRYRAMKRAGTICLKKTSRKIVRKRGRKYKTPGYKFSTRC